MNATILLDKIGYCKSLKYAKFSNEYFHNYGLKKLTKTGQHFFNYILPPF